MGVGNYAQAEHYLFALLADAVVKGKREAILEVNKVREYYGVKAIPLSDDDLEDDDDLQGKTRLTAADEQATACWPTTTYLIMRVTGWPSSWW